MDKELFQTVRSPSLHLAIVGKKSVSCYMLVMSIQEEELYTFLLILAVAEFQMLSFLETHRRVCGPFLSFVVFSHFGHYQQRCVIISILASP